MQVTGRIEGTPPASVGSAPMVICIPVYNDWQLVPELVRRIDRTLCGMNSSSILVLVDDCSAEPPPSRFSLEYRALRQVYLLRLRCNLGHQRAIAIGLAYIHDHFQCRSIVIMDGDGEDAPEDIPRLLSRFESCGESHVVFARRARRLETPVFRGFYKAYRLLHWLLTGRSVEVGNFSVLSMDHAASLVGVSELWNHYAASVFKVRLLRQMVPIDRGRRIAGRSKMSFTSLVTHGLSAISVFADTVGVRLLVLNAVFALLCVIGVMLVLVIRLLTDLAIPGWATLAAGILFIFLVQSILLSLVFVFVTLQGRNTSTFLPIRDYQYFVGAVRRLDTDE
ncbi:MAG: glycosyltransferase [Planctomycetes bacterium]|nr:glycosyltransferase [Planctomycetota bacterium]